jgi:DNA-binding NarL/FixJ family response regulator
VDAAGQRVEPLMARILALPPVTGPAPGAPRIPDDLTPREVEVLALLAMGHSDGEIALALAMSPKTVSVHVGRAKEKLGATSRVDLALRAHALGIADAGRAPAVEP